ncbi:bifunctional methylenetetrahydrofolate dehydrogenase/methenyltetrahydrofolate cyclohydrolase FolD [Saccharospirillum salsuginis]|uniref:Bifunctional protein FolD n=1 Tax=Saccharospirillum salsuginis TaxID=418750 RepID=A0A918N9W5_9GAMM|nr:bifunctional methylenetetrahydrofolate dehydrogenase/methenyltetrahydrofolate cyclohydrolase FolD [Saccharospirillum salsuginis]GGX57290.1 bifunctional protein FolD [Saccharospirillum salsuginis]
MTAQLIDGKAFAATLREKVADHVAHLKRTHGVTPGLAVVLVGDDPASQVYVRSKQTQTLVAGMHSYEYTLPSETSETDLLGLIRELNADPDVHGILVQLPLSDHIDEASVIESIDPAKDVDGFHPVNVGRLATGQTTLVPCTPMGCLMMLREYGGRLTGQHAVVIGRSNIVGKPMAQLLLRENCTVTVAHSKTVDLASLVNRADIVVATVGRPHFVQGEWLKTGATVIDVGINRIDQGDDTTRLVGDVDFDTAKDIACAITPVPGGVGPMTIACLLANTVTACCRQLTLPEPVGLTV